MAFKLVNLELIWILCRGKIWFELAMLQKLIHGFGMGRTRTTSWLAGWQRACCIDRNFGNIWPLLNTSRVLNGWEGCDADALGTYIPRLNARWLVKGLHTRSTIGWWSAFSHDVGAGGGRWGRESAIDWGEIWADYLSLLCSFGYFLPNYSISTLQIKLNQS